ncbi:MAG: Ppx/GppA family phosphatase [Planctomycetes bacterium]|nr:Ppx/GppA family phosphatase [Planctomycetota bacterium]
MSPQRPAETIAAVDLGSNSFHMVVARLVDDLPMPVDRLRERVALAAGLDEKGRISKEAQQRAVECLERFGQRLRDHHSSEVRAVATNTLRRASKPEEFLARLEAALGHRIDVIDGSEEARLIYLGVANDLADDTDRRLVIDIGGGSTEFIVGERAEPLRLHSLPMGCIAYARRFFGAGRIDDASFAKAEAAARLELRPYKRQLRDMGWDDCIGSSGTNAAIERLLVGFGRAQDGFTLEDLKFLRAELVKRGSPQKLDTLTELGEDRRDVIAPGLAILIGAFESLRIKRMHISRSALREGVLHDLVGRLHHADVRDASVRNLMQQYRVDEGQAERVKRTAEFLFEAARKPWKLGVYEHQLVDWACSLHEIGLYISLRRHNQHSAYLAENSVMPGFSRSTQETLAFLLRAQRGKALPELWERQTAAKRHMAVLLRLAVRLSRGRSTRPLDLRGAEIDGMNVFLVFEPGWMERHPMTRADLEKEVKQLSGVGYRLSISEAP